MRKNIFVIEGALAAAAAIALSFTAPYTNDNASSVTSEASSAATVEESTAVGVAGMFRDIELQASLIADGDVSLETEEFVYVTAALEAAEVKEEAESTYTVPDIEEAETAEDGNADDAPDVEEAEAESTDTAPYIEEAGTVYDGTDDTDVAGDAAALTEEEQEWLGYLMPNVKNVLNVRESADADSDLVGKLYKGDRAVIVEQGDEWTKITSGNVEGYVKNSYCLFGLDALSYAKENCDVIAKSTIDGLRVRKEPSTDADVCGKLDEGTKLTVVKNAEAVDGWVAVSYKDSTCYVSADYVIVSMKLGTGVTIAEEKKAAEEAKKAESKSSKSSSKSSSKKSSSGKICDLAYEADDVTLLAALIDCEAGGQEYEALLAVGACVMNRVNSSSYPDTIFDVIHQKGQFPPATSGSLEKRLKNGPSKSAIKAAKAAIAGEDNIDGKTNFQMVTSGHSGTVIGDNVFY